MTSQSGIGPVRIRSKPLRFLIVLFGLSSVALAVRSLFQENAPDITSTAFVILGIVAVWVASIGFIPGIREVSGVKLSGLVEIATAAAEHDEETLAALLKAQGVSSADIKEVQVRSQPAFAREVLDTIESATGVTIQRVAEIPRDGARNVVVSGTFTVDGKRVAVDADHSLSGARASYPVTRLRVALTHSAHYDLALLIVPESLRETAETLVRQDGAANGPLPDLKIVTDLELPQIANLLTGWLSSGQ